MIRLIPTRPHHAEILFPILSDPELYRFTGDRPPSDLAELERFFLAETASKTVRSWVIWCDTIAAPVGRIASRLSGDAAEVSLVIGRQHQGQGYGLTSLEAAFNGLYRTGVIKVTATIDVKNIRAQRLVEKAGLSRSGCTAIADVTDMGEYFYERGLP